MLFRKKSCSIVLALSTGLICLLTILHIEKRVEFQAKFLTNATLKRNQGVDNFPRFDNTVSKKEDKNRRSGMLRTLSSAGNISDESQLYDRVKTFLMFIGYPRSGTTIVGSLLDAHPNVIVAHEYNLGRKWTAMEEKLKTRKFVFNELFKNSYYHSIKGQRAKNYKAIFNYHVPGLWQGKFKDNIQVIGDKKGGATTRVLSDMEGNYISDLQNSLHISVKMIHIIRNPFDNIATMALRVLKVRGKAITDPSVQIRNDKVLADRIKMYFGLVHSNYKIKKKYGNLVYDVKYTRLLNNPPKVLRKICRFLNITCDNHYINECARKIFLEETKTRKNFYWPEDLKKKVSDQIKRYSFLEGFTF